MNHYFSFNLNKYYTIENENLELFGRWEETKYTCLSIIVQECDNSENPNFCATKEEIKKYISNGVNLNINFLPNRIRVSNYSDPNPTYITTLYKYVMFSYTKITSFQIQNNIIETDSGLFFEDKSSTEFLSLLETSTDSTNNHYYDKDRVIFVIYSSNISNYTFRKYIKVPDILASLGGLTDILCFIFGLINFPFCEINRNCGVIDLLFKHDELKKPNNSINF